MFGDGKLVTDENGPVEIDMMPDGGELVFTLPEDDWYVLQVVRDDEANGGRDNNQGYAWLRVEGVELYSSREEATTSREDEYGPTPIRDRAFYAEEKAYRFDGARTFGEFISLQVSPMFNNMVVPLAGAALLFVNGWVIGILGKRERRVRRWTLIGWTVSLPVLIIVLYGFEGSRVLPRVPTSIWEGLLLTMILTFVGITASFPLGVALALGRRSDLPAIKWTCTLFIETIRGVPLITILFMAKLIVPFFWSALSDLDLTLRMMIGLTLFSAAYLAENVRGGLQIVEKGQVEAARALGMNPFLTTTFIVLPQALRVVIPAIVGQFISLFKDTSLVALVGVFELVGMVDIIVNGQTIYRPYQREAYIFIAILYFIISYAMSDVSRRLETSGAGRVRQIN
ncbi:MAG: amino acid ABC transporter permease [Anaerolineae bacterium]|nr:amino acid ABC transporter permease [Anaerolineae bacterium]